MRRLAVLIAAAAVLTACGGGARTVTVGKVDDGSTLRLRPHDTLVVRLDSNRTTGFRWNLVGRPDPGVLALVSSTYEAPDSGLVGAGGTEIWTLRASGSGTTQLQLAYYRPFDKQDVQGTFVLNVTVG